ncbi:MAG: CHASE domain-containing protein, partial [Pseudomonadota bacterium]
MKGRRGALISAFAVASMILAVVIVTEVVFAQRGHEAAVAEDIRRAEQAREVIERRLRRTEWALRNVGIAVRQSRAAGRSTTFAFHDFVRRSEILREHPELHGVAYLRRTSVRLAPRVAAGFDADDARRALGYPPLRLRPEPAARERVFVAMLEPVERGHLHAGRDVMGLSRAATVQAATQAREARLTRPVRLIYGQSGVALYHPVFFGPTDTSPMGFVTTSFLVSDMLRELAPILSPLGAQIEVHDVTALAPGATPGAATLLAKIDTQDGEDGDRRRPYAPGAVAGGAAAGGGSGPGVGTGAAGGSAERMAASGRARTRARG